MNRYEQMEKIGQGSFGVVYKAKPKDTDRIAALKNMNLVNRLQCCPGTVLWEVSILKELDHPNIVKMQHFVREKQTGILLIILWSSSKWT
jgi:serine/threonine protein kinase